MTARTRACRFSSARPSSFNAFWYSSKIGAIGIVSSCRPVRSASSAASERECSLDHSLGLETPKTFSAPRASTAMVATSVESMPPDSPIRTLVNPFLAT